MKAAPFLFALTMSLTGCVQTSAPNATSVVQPKDVVQPIPSARAVQLFDNICGASLANDFASAKSLMAKNGIAKPSPFGTATVYSSTDDLSFQVQDGPGFGNTCSMVWGTPEGKSAVTAAVSKIGKFSQTPLGATALYRGQRYIVLFDGGSQKLGTVTYYNLKLLSDN